MKYALNILQAAEKQKTPKRVRVSGHKVNELRKQAVTEIFGTKCQLCGGWKSRLHLAHLYYNPKSTSANGRTKARQREAIAHPERFVLLCVPCHLTFDTIQKNGGYRFIEKINLLMRRAADEAASYLMSAGVFK